MKAPALTTCFGAASLLLAAALTSCDTARNTTEDSSASTVTTVESPAASGPVSFSRQLTQGDYRFDIQTTGSGNEHQLTVRLRRGDALLTDPVRLNMKGNVSDAVLGDLNGNGTPELYLFTTASGGMEAFELNDKTLVPIADPARLSNDLAAGYKGEDKYQIQGNRLVRTFPVYSGTDASATSTGSTRTIEYTLGADGRLTQGNTMTSPPTNASGNTTSGTGTGTTGTGTTTGTTPPRQ